MTLLEGHLAHLVDEYGLPEVCRSLSSVVRASLPPKPDCLSPVPEGYDTVLGYLARNHPDVLDMIDYTDPQATVRDGFWLRNRTRGLELWVPAPGCLLARGIKRVRAYPVELLAQRWA